MISQADLNIMAKGFAELLPKVRKYSEDEGGRTWIDCVAMVGEVCFRSNPKFSKDKWIAACTKSVK